MQSTLEILVKLKDEASASLQKFNVNFKQMAAIGTAGFAAVTGAVALSVKEFASAGDEMQKMAIRTGFSTEALSKLKFAAQQSGSSIGSFEVAFKSMSREMIGNSDRIKKALEGNLVKPFDEIMGMGSEEMFFTLADSVASIEDPIKRSAVAMEVFGKSGTELLPLFDEGRDGMAKLYAEAERLGIVFDQNAANAAAKFSDSMDSLKGSFDGVKFAIAEALIPILNEMVDKITPIIITIKDWAKEHPELTQQIIIATAAVFGIIAAVGTLGLAIPMIVTGLTLLGGTLGIVIAIFAGLVLAVTNVIQIYNILKNESELVWEGIKIIIKEKVDAIVGYFQPLIDILTAVWNKITAIADRAKSVAGGVVSSVSGFLGNAVSGARSLVGLAEGGIVTGPTLAMVGEGGGPEAVIPLDRMGSFGGNNITVNLSGNFYGSDEELAEKMGDKIADIIGQQLKIRTI